MTAGQLSRLFRDGMQFNSNELQGGGGTGLGLFIAKGIVKQHKGSLSAASDGLNKGSTFSLSLPVWHVPEPTQHMKVSVEHRPDSEISSTPKISERKPRGDHSASLRILVVEDVKSNRKLLCRLLANKGHACEEAENGLVAVKMVKEAEAAGNPYDSILMDYEVCINQILSAVLHVPDALHPSFNGSRRCPSCRVLKRRKGFGNLALTWILLVSLETYSMTMWLTLSPKERMKLCSSQSTWTSLNLFGASLVSTKT